MTRTRQHRTRPTTALPDATLEDRALTFRARGLLGAMLTKPDGWDFSADRIARESAAEPFGDGAAPASEGREAIRTALRELRRRGYVRLTRRQLSQAEAAADPDHPRAGSWRSEYEVSDAAMPEWAAQYARDKGAPALVAAPDDGSGVKPQVAPETGQPAPVQPDVGAPDVGSPDVGSVGAKELLNSRDVPTEPLTGLSGTSDTHSSPNPTADAAGGSRCAKHPERPHSNCRGCGTTARQLAAAVRVAEEATRRAADAEALAAERARPRVPPTPEFLAAREALARRRRSEP